MSTVTGTKPGQVQDRNGALRRIRAFAADVIVTALGLDAHENDPFQGLAITTPGFARIAARIRAEGLPVLMVQEGVSLGRSRPQPDKLSERSRGLTAPQALHCVSSQTGAGQAPRRPPWRRPKPCLREETTASARPLR
ncbi:MAG: hypothetical protein ACI807_003499 [Paracoccaceae bacterium]|jgi:hypothetical protein